MLPVQRKMHVRMRMHGIKDEEKEIVERLLLTLIFAASQRKGGPNDSGGQCT